MASSIVLASTAPSSATTLLMFSSNGISKWLFSVGSSGVIVGGGKLWSPLKYMMKYIMYILTILLMPASLM